MSILEQNTPEWEAMRKGKIGASDAPVIVEASPYKTPFRLWEEKLGLVAGTGRTEAMQRGHDMEPVARAKLEEMTGMLFLPAVKFHSSIEWMMCSLDGISLDETTIAEIKCSGKKAREATEAGIVPEKYFPQLQHQMEVCGKEEAIYFSFDGKDGASVKVVRDDRFIKKMLEKEKKFYECLQNFEPPALVDKDFVYIDDSVRSRLASDWIALNKSIKELQEQEKGVRNELISYSPRSSIGGGLKISKITRKGNVDYGRIPELKNVKLDDYRKRPIETWKLTDVSNA
jgi:putative phage-type endonuclease